jgi:hypothetical protein
MLVPYFILLGVLGVSRRLGGELAVSIERYRQAAKKRQERQNEKEMRLMGWLDSLVIWRVAICLTEKYSPCPWRFSAPWR